MIHVTDLVKTFTRGFGPWRVNTPVLRGFNFTARPGEVTGILGPNGAGKTTLFRIIAGMESATSGLVRVNGVDPWHEPGKIRGMVALLPEDPGVPRIETGQSHLFEFGIMMGMTPSQVRTALEKADESLMFSSFWTRGFQTYSRGQKARIALARMLLMPEASVMIFDEPSNGLDFESVARLHKFIRSQAREGKVVLVTSHILADLKRLCDRLVGIKDGQAATPDMLESWVRSHEELRGAGMLDGHGVRLGEEEGP